MGVLPDTNPIHLKNLVEGKIDKVSTEFLGISVSTREDYFMHACRKNTEYHCHPRPNGKSSKGSQTIAIRHLLTATGGPGFSPRFAHNKYRKNRMGLHRTFI